MSQNCQVPPNKKKSLPLFTAFRNYLKTYFAIDTRSLAIFRIALALLILIDLGIRSTDLIAHYSDFGILPRDVLIGQFMNDSYISLHLLSGNVYVIVALFIVAALFAVMLLLGYKTKLATIVSWILLVSLHNRNDMILNGGDVLFRLLLFWGMFLPLGATYSLDSIKEKSKERAHLSVASAALLFQVAYVYVFSALLKDNPIWTLEGTAVYYALSVDQFTRPLGYVLYQFPELMKLLSFGTLYLELYGPIIALFLIFPKHIPRTLMAFSFMLMHLGFTLTMELGIFPYIGMAAWLVFLPSSFWEWFLKFLNPEPDDIAIYYDLDCGFCRQMVAIISTALALRCDIRTAQSEVETKAEMERMHSWVIKDKKGTLYTEFFAFIELCKVSPILFWIAPFLSLKPCTWIGNKLYRFVADNRGFFGRFIHTYRGPVTEKFLFPQLLTSIIALFFFLYITGWNIRTLDFDKYQKFFPQTWNVVGYTLRIDQYWNMFAPYPLMDDGWYVIVGTQTDGRDINVQKSHEKYIDWEKPEFVAQTYKNQRWRKFMMNIWERSNTGYREPYAKYLCWNWNQNEEHAQQLSSIKIYFVEERTLPNYGVEEPKEVLLHTQNCFI
ncbi:HTTM domain-containing protein [Candidatus Dojkabacteria bacterium]|uniref:HTTM domain-containing protein n=1 Tax=Candidatus Dojkabacteria bacterium TaxID=2099670 RepID=A0A955RKM5_9BACT|nr:HTTM domain-containing protein [Candidatus Dojkabacteria bacterium]